MITYEKDIIIYLLENNGRDGKGCFYHKIYTFGIGRFRAYKACLTEEESMFFLRETFAELLWSKKEGVTERALEIFPRLRGDKNVHN